MFGRFSLAKIKYTPFLKLKANEVGAFTELSDPVRNSIVPFFDLPAKREMTADSFCLMVDKAAKKLDVKLGKEHPFFLDNFDIPDSILVKGKTSYSYVVEAFSALNFIPVLGLNRSPTHNQVVFDEREAGTIRSSRVAIRLVDDEFDNFELIEDELSELMSSIDDAFGECILILDCRLCLNLDPTAKALQIQKFISKARSQFSFTEIIVTGSSIPASIGQVIKTEEVSDLERIELKIFAGVLALSGMDHIGLGDYTIVSPLYADFTLEPEMFLNVTAPKVLYANKSTHYIARGGALKTHIRGNQQYNDMCVDLMKLSIYRGKHYSRGDLFIAEKAAMLGTIVTPGSILKPTINAHMTYMATDHPLVV
jgi:Beta protein